MPFNYTPASNVSGGPLNFGTRLDFGTAPHPLTSGAQQQTVDYGAPNQFQQSPQQSGMNPMQMYNLYKQFAGSGAASSGSGGASAGLLSTGGGTAAGLGGSGLIGSAGGATSAAASGGASYGLGGSLVGGTGAVGGSTFAAGAGAGAAGGGAAAGGAAAGGAAAGGGAAAAGGGAAAGAAGGGAAAAGGAGGAMAAMGPWGILAAIIMANEEDSRKKGLRDENKAQRTQDQFTGKVATQDIEGKWGPMLDRWTGGKSSSSGYTGDMKGASQVASGRIAPGVKSLWNEGSVRNIRNLFS